MHPCIHVKIQLTYPCVSCAFPKAWLRSLRSARAWLGSPTSPTECGGGRHAMSQGGKDVTFSQETSQHRDLKKKKAGELLFHIYVHDI